MNEARVIIVGGGAAGIAAATRLVQNGFQNVTVLEAEDRLGGRCNTVTLGDEHVDLGAQWIHGESQNVVHDMAAPINLTKDSVFGKKSFYFILPNGKPMSLEVSRALYGYCIKTLERTEQQLPQNSNLLLNEVDIKNHKKNLQDLNDPNTFRRELPSSLCLGEVYKQSFNDNQYGLEGFNNLNQCVGHEQELLENLTSSTGEVSLESSNDSIKHLKEDDIISDRETSQKQELPSNRVLHTSEVQNNNFDKNLKDVTKFSISGMETHQEQDLANNCALSIGEVFMKSFKENLKDLDEFKISNQEVHLFLEWYNKFHDSYSASDSWYDISFEGYLKYRHCGGNQHVAWKTGGYSNIMDILLQKMPKTKSEISLNVRFGKEVVEITRKNKVVVKCADGSIFTADHVIVSVSLGVLKYAQSMFNPPLPPYKLLAIDTIALGVAEKLFLQFPHKWWPEDSALLNILLDSHSKEEFQRIGKKWLVGVVAFFVLDNAPNTLCAWVGGNSARCISKLPDNVVRDDLHYFLKRYLSDVYTIPAPVRFVRSNWFGNPHFRGAYSFVTVRANVSGSSSDDLADPILDESGKPVLMFAGEATHPHFFSTVHGAVETGWREADRLTTCYKKSYQVWGSKTIRSVSV